jgi:hypothetical protein
MMPLLSSPSPAAPTEDLALYGAPRKASRVEHLEAGPVRLTFADGELRRLCVGGKEIIRRIYVSVRDTRWDTVEPEITGLDVQRSRRGFTIRLDALCRGKGIDFSWYGDITGTPDGRVTFRVRGAANTACRANRFGLCVLYGAESLAGQGYEVRDAEGRARTAAFPDLLDAVILQDKFQSLRYTTAEGLRVTTSVTDTLFGMEDQRQFGDSSYKAFSAMTFPYPDIVKGAAGTESISVSVENVPGAVRGPRKRASDPPIVARLGDPLPHARVPKLVPYDKALAQPGFFMDVSTTRDKLREAPVVTWPFNVAVNLFDDETLIENLPAVADQVRTARVFAPRAVLRVAPATFNPPWPRESPDPRNRGQFAAAWLAGTVSHLARSGADEVMFDTGPGPAERVERILAAHAGQPVLATPFKSNSRPSIEALAVDDHGTRFVWLINLTPRQQKVVVEGLSEGARLELERVNAATPSPADRPAGSIPAKRGRCQLLLSPFEVCQVRVVQ